MKIIKFSLMLLLVFFAVFFIHAYSPVITSWDSNFSPLVVESIIKQGNTSLNEYESILKREPNMRYSYKYINGNYYSLYPIGTPLIAVPVYLAYKYILSQALYYCNDTHCAQLIIASFIVALTAVFIYLIGYLSTGNAVISSLLVTIFAFCTSAWSVASRALWQHGPSMLVLSIALFLILLAKKRPFLIKFAALPIAFSYLIRPTNTISIVLLTLFVFLEYRRYFFSYLLWSLFVFVPFLIYTFNIYNSVLPYYYVPLNNFGGVHRHFWAGLAGHLFSPSRGIFIFSPILIFSLYGMFLKLSARRIEKLDLFLVLIICIHWIVISYYPDWTGGFSIGNRYFSDLMPYFVFFLVPAIVKITQVKGVRQTIPLVVFFSLMTVSFMIHYRCVKELGPARWNNKIYDNKWSMSLKVWDWQDIQFLN